MTETPMQPDIDDPIEEEETTAQRQEATDTHEADEQEEQQEEGFEPLDFYDNLVETLSPEEETKLASKYAELYQRDKAARENRDKLYAEGIRRTGLGDDAPGGAAFDGASRAVHPGLNEACIDFAARAMRELFPPAGPVKQKIDGKVTKDKVQRAERKTRHMNFQLTKEVAEYRNVLEQVLTQAPLAGVGFIKFYPDFVRKRPACEFVRLDAVYLPYSAGDFYTAQRVGHRQLLTEYEFEQRVSSGMYIDVDYAIAVSDPENTQVQSAMDKVEGKQSTGYNEDGLREIVEFYCYENINDDGIAPYIITLDVSTDKLLSVYRNWEEGDETKAKMDWLIKFGFLPWDGPLEIGLTHAIGGLSAAATGSLRALLDSAHIQNSMSGIILKGAGVTGQSKRAQPTQLVEMKAPPGMDDIRKVVHPFPFNGPSGTLLELLQFLDTQMRGVVRTAVDQSDDNPNIPVGTKLASIEQGLVVYSSIHARMHAAQAKVLEVLHRINKMYMESEYDPELGFATKEDYEADIDVQPVSDPNIFSDFQRAGQNTLLRELSMEAPDLFDRRAIYKRILTASRVPDIDEVMPDKGAQDQNPATENIMMAMGTPVMALPDQDHLAHLQVHLDFANSPALGQSPVVSPTFAPLFIEHAKQHILFYYGQLLRERVESALGVDIQAIQDEDPEIAKKLSQAVAAASPLVLTDLVAHVKGVIPIVEQAQQYVQSMQPPPPQDPTQVAAQQVQADAKAKADKTQADVEAKRETNATNLKVAEIKANTDMQKNRDDNETALTIASMRELSGHSPGNIKDGTGLGE